MEEKSTVRYKPAKKLKEQIEYLKDNKRVLFDVINEETATDILLKYNYINVITPFKHEFAKTDEKFEVIKVEDKHVYENDVQFKEYYDMFSNERKQYPIIYKNIIDFDIHFKSILAYHVLNNIKLETSDDLFIFLDSLKINAGTLDYKPKRLNRMIDTLEAEKRNVKKMNVYCFFDRLSLGSVLTIFNCLERSLQDKIFLDLKKYNQTLGTIQVPEFLKKVFCLVSIRNTIMHGNSLQILVRFYGFKGYDLRTSSDKRKYTSLIKLLSKEKHHD